MCDCIRTYFLHSIVVTEPTVRKCTSCIIRNQVDNMNGFYPFIMFMPNGMPQPYQLDESISNLRVVR